MGLVWGIMMDIITAKEQIGYKGKLKKLQYDLGRLY
jgi:hypothetical protein